MILNPFSSDAFEMAALTAAINKIPNTYGRLERLNLMPPQGVRTRTIIIEEMSGVLNLLPTQPVGAPGTAGITGKRKVRSFVIPHISHDDYGPRRSRAFAPLGPRPRLTPLPT